MRGKGAAMIAFLAVAVTGCAQASSTRAAGDQSVPPPSATATGPTSPAASVVPSDLQAALNQLPLPPGSVRLKAAAEPSQPTISLANAPGKVTAVGYWRSPLSRVATVSWLAAHLPPTWTGGGMGMLGEATSTAEYDRQPTARLKGPNYTFSVEDTTGGASVVVTAWEIPLQAKAADESLSGVTGATLSTKDEVAPTNAPPLRRVTLSPDQAELLASDIDALTVDDGSAHGCTEGSPDVVMDFTTATGKRTFLYSRNCHSVEVVGEDKGPVLDAGVQLYDQVDALLKTATEPVRGTLIVTLAPNMHTQGEAGSITVSRQGTKVDSGRVANGHVYITTQLPGVYDLTATSAGGACKPGTATVVAEQQVDVTLICTPAP